MSISYVNIDKKNNEPKLSLCKPNLEHTKIGNLTDIYDFDLTINEGILNELNITMPVYVERNHQLVKNPMIEKFNGMYHVRSEWNGRTEYFVYTKGNRKLSSSGKEYNYKLISLGHLLNKKIIRLYEETSKSLSWFVADFLRESDWFIGYVDSSFDLKSRSFESTETTILQAIFDIAKKFGALIEWDTVNQKINFHKPELTSKNKGFKIRDEVFLESLDAEINYDAIVTRLYVYGEDGLEFRRLSPTGSNYIESFDWYMFPFECDTNYNVLKSSKHMSDSLCVAIRKYEKKVETYSPTFKTLTTNKTAKQDEIQQREQELSVLEADLERILNERDMINGTYQDEAPSRSDWQNVINRMNAKNAEITSKTTQISGLKNQLANIDSQIDSMRNELKTENNYTSVQLRELNKFINHETYVNDSISNEDDLLEDALVAFKKYNAPPTSLNISLVNFLKDIEFENIRNRIAIGDTVTARIKDLDLELSMRISQIKYSYESESVSLTVTNLIDLRDDWQQFLSKIYTASNTSTVVDMSKHLWDGVTKVGGLVNDMLNSAFDTGKNILLGGFENTVSITPRGLYSKHLYDPNTYLVINMAQLLITKNNGNSIEVAISAEGIHAEKLVGRIILSTKLHVEDVLGVVEIQSGLQTIYDQSGKPRVYLGRYPTFENPSQFNYGLRVIDGAFDMRTSSTSNSGIVINGTSISAFNNNSVKTFNVDAVTGKVSIIGSLSIKTSLDSNRGTLIDDSGLTVYGNSGQIVFRADHFGNIYYTGKLDGAYGNVQDLTGSIQGMDGTFKGDLVASGGTFTGTLNGVDGTFSGSLSAASGSFSGSLSAATGTFAGDISAASGTFNGTVTSQAVSAVTIEVDQLRANSAQVTDLSAISSNLGNITGGSIQIDTDMKIGNNLYIGNNSDWMSEKSIIFAGSSGITYRSDALSITAIGEINLEATRINVIGDLYVNGSPIS